MWVMKVGTLKELWGGLIGPSSRWFESGSVVRGYEHMWEATRIGLFDNFLIGSVGRIPLQPWNPLDHSIHTARRHHTRPCAQSTVWTKKTRFMSGASIASPARSNVDLRQIRLCTRETSRTMVSTGCQFLSDLEGILLVHSEECLASAWLRYESENGWDSSPSGLGD